MPKTLMLKALVRAKSAVLGPLAHSRVFPILLILGCSMALQAGTPEALAVAVGNSAKPWINWLIRLVAGGMSGGGFWALITGLNGNDEGFMKGLKVFGGLFLMGAGIYCLVTPDTIYTTLSLDKMFTTQ